MAPMAQGDTIFAVATAQGRAGIAVIRVSGPAAGQILDDLAPPRPRPRRVALRAVLNPRTREVLDRGLALWCPGPASFSGEDVAELHLHGSRAVLNAVLAVLAARPGCRMAEPGEFARRAFETGKLDLAEAEGLADLIDAETEAQRRQALNQAAGTQSKLFESWRGELVTSLALVEAAIDFSDEGDVGRQSFDRARAAVAALRPQLKSFLDDGHRGEILREGYRVALAGPPNVGKSSLLNALARRPAAIVSEEAGTTRDVIEVHLDLGGFPVIVADTAGIRQTVVKVEKEGIRRSMQAARTADLVVWLLDAHDPDAAFPPALKDVAQRTLPVLNKVDLLPMGRPKSLPPEITTISVRTGQGIEELTRRISRLAAERVGPTTGPVITSARHRNLIETAVRSMDDFLAGDPSAIELRAEDLRRAADALGRITGRVDVEDVLDQVFKRFCIGK